MDRDNEKQETIAIYTIIETGADADHGFFPDPCAYGSFLSLDKAREVMAGQIQEAKAELGPRYDTINSGDDFWEAYEDGYAAARFYRIEIIKTVLNMEKSRIAGAVLGAVPAQGT